MKSSPEQIIDHKTGPSNASVARLTVNAQAAQIPNGLPHLAFAPFAERKTVEDQAEAGRKDALGIGKPSLKTRAQAHEGHPHGGSCDVVPRGTVRYVE